MLNAGRAEPQDGAAAPAAEVPGAAVAASGAGVSPRVAHGRSSTVEPLAGSTGPTCPAAAASHAAEQDVAAAPALQHEWEAGSGSGVVGSELSDLFHEPVDMQVRPSSVQGAIFAVRCSSQARGSWPAVVSSEVRSHVRMEHQPQLYLRPCCVCHACQEVVEELRPGLELRVALMPRQHCHTASHTALMVWQAARPLAQLLLRCPAFFQCKASASKRRN